MRKRGARGGEGGSGDDEHNLSESKGGPFLDTNDTIDNPVYDTTTPRDNHSLTILSHAYNTYDTINIPTSIELLRRCRATTFVY